jgi:Tfp pilus assembly protein FimT
MKNFFQKGITGLEMLVVVAVLAIIFAIVTPQFAKIREGAVVKAAIEDVLSSINKAKNQTISSVDSSEYGVHFESDRVIIFKGTVFSSGASTNETVNITSPASISNITITGGGADIYFNRLSGAPNTSGSIIVSSTNFSKTITISATGVASVN